MIRTQITKILCHENLELYSIADFSEMDSLGWSHTETAAIFGHKPGFYVGKPHKTRPFHMRYVYQS